MSTVMLRFIFLYLCLMLFSWFSLSPARVYAEERIVVDLARYDVPISTGFSGSNLLLFGAAPGDGDILVKLRGPAQNYLVLEKKRFAGLWLNGERTRIDSAPAFFHIFTSGDEGDDWLSSFEKARNDFSLKDLRINVSPDKSQFYSYSKNQRFRDAFIRRQRNLGLYGERPKSIDKLGNNLFRVLLTLPAGLPTGTYIIETFLVSEGKVLSAQATPLFVRRSGSGAVVFNFAEQFSFLYGFCAVVLALAAGFLANRLFVWR